MRSIRSCAHPTVLLAAILVLLLAACSRDDGPTPTTPVATRTARHASPGDPAHATLTAGDVPDRSVAGPGLRAGGVWQPLAPQATADGPRLGGNPFVLSTVDVYRPGEAAEVMEGLRNALRSNVTQAMLFPGSEGKTIVRRVYLWAEQITAVGDERIAVAFEAATGDRGYLVVLRRGDIIGFVRHYAVGEAPDAPDLEETERLARVLDERVSRLLTTGQ